MTTKRNTAGEPEVVTSIRLTPNQHARLKAIAASQHRSLSQQMRVIVDAAIAQADAVPADPSPVA